MATRPTIPVTVRATDATYTGIGNDLDTTPTKITRSGAELALGYVPDSPLGTYPISAQGVNFEHNRNDQWVEWVSLGSPANGADTHIVETDSSGDINIVGANCVNVRVAPNVGEDGVEVITTGGSKGLEVTQDATCTDHGVHVTALDGAAAPAFFASTRSSVGMLISGGSTTGLSIGMVANGGAVGPSIDLAANTVEPTDDSVGTFWNHEQNSINNVKMGMGSSGGYPVIAKNALCYARSVSAAHALTGSVLNQALGATFSFKADQIPQAASEVLVTIWGRISLSSGQDNTVVLRVRDKDAADATVCEIFIYTGEHSTVTQPTIRMSATIAEVYQLPAAGAREFDLVWTGNTTGVSGTFTGFVEISEMRG